MARLPRFRMIWFISTVPPVIAVAAATARATTLVAIDWTDSVQ